MKDERQESRQKCKRQNRDYRRRHEQAKKKKAVTFTPKFIPWLYNRAAVSHDAIRKDKSTPRANPHQYEYESKTEHYSPENQRNDPYGPLICGANARRAACGEGAPNAVAIPIRIKIPEMDTTSDVCEKSGKTDHEPFRYVERAKENFFRELEGFFEWFEDFYFGFGPIHVGHFKPSIGLYQASILKLAWKYRSSAR